MPLNEWSTRQKWSHLADQSRHTHLSSDLLTTACDRPLCDYVNNTCLTHTTWKLTTVCVYEFSCPRVVMLTTNQYTVARMHNGYRWTRATRNLTPICPLRCTARRDQQVTVVDRLLTARPCPHRRQVLSTTDQWPSLVHCTRRRSMCCC